MKGIRLSVSLHPRLALVGDHGNHQEPSHPRIDAMIPGLPVSATWIPTAEIVDTDVLEGYHAVWVVPGAPYVNQHGVHLAVRHAREHGLPFLGTCGGFFSALLEYAQNVLELPEAIGVDEDPDRLLPLVIPLNCVLRGQSSPLTIAAGSRLSAVYGGATRVEEIFHCEYGLLSEFTDAATRGGLRFTGWDRDGSPRALELSDRPFYIGTLFQPELVSSPGSLHPLLTAFIEAVIESAASAPQARPGAAVR